MLNKKCGFCVRLITSLGVLISVAIADPLPLPGSVLTNGVQKDTFVNVPSGNPTYPVTFGFGSGGGFTATIDNTNTVMWCVDAMEDISPPATYNADLVEVSQIGSNSSYVRYGGVSSWSTAITGDNTAQQRYEMATYLTSKYPGVPAGPTQPYTLTDQELQAAIWEIMWNNSISSESGITLTQVQNGDGAFNSADENAVAKYIAAAQNFVNNPANASFFNNYAVVSGAAGSNGTLATSGFQTFIVPLDSPVPEPASIVLLGSLIAGVFTLTRRQRARRVSQMS
jgi:hypothetical protein